jgi:hypothetical protein
MLTLFITIEYLQNLEEFYTAINMLNRYSEL